MAGAHVLCLIGQVPPLRLRTADVADLAAYFARQVSARTGAPRAALDPAALRRLESYNFPGNIAVCSLRTYAQIASLLISGSWPVTRL